MPILLVARRDLAHVVDGRTVDGKPLGKTVSFPHRLDSLAAASVLAHIIYTFIDASHPGLSNDPAIRTSIVFKLLAYLSRTGRVSNEAIRASVQDVANIATMLAEQPKLITEPVNFAKVLVRHQAFMAAYRKALQKPLDQLPVLDISHAPQKPLIWQSADKEFHLHELTHPLHLVAVFEALGHCVDRLRGNRPVTKVSQLPDLPYWADIVSGKARVFSFGYRKQMLCTLQLALNPPTIVQLQGKTSDPVRPCKPYYSALLQAIEYLDTTFNGELRFRMPPWITRQHTMLPELAPPIENRFKRFLDWRR